MLLERYGKLTMWKSKSYLSVHNILCLFDWLISSVGVRQMWLSVLINQSKLYSSVYNILCLFDWLVSSVGVR